MTGLWRWITENKDALTAVGTVAGAVVTLVVVVVAAIYAVFTRRLVSAARTQAEASLKQAQVTQRMFEASHRPYLNVQPSRMLFLGRENFVFAFSLRNRGSLPAALVGWHATLSRNGETVAERRRDEADAGVTIFPGYSHEIEFQLGSGSGVVEPPPSSLEIEVVVEYRGVPESHYTTRLSADTRAGSWGARSLDVQ